VYVLEEHRGRGLGKRLVEAVRAHPDLRSLRRLLLKTRDAHGLYEPFGFARVGDGHDFMQIRGEVP
jgi:GNAT superfamily N-acetyltransferase